MRVITVFFVVAFVSVAATGGSWAADKSKKSCSNNVNNEQFRVTNPADFMNKFCQESMGYDGGKFYPTKRDWGCYSFENINKPLDIPDEMNACRYAYRNNKKAKVVGICFWYDGETSANYRSERPACLVKIN